MDHPFSWLRYLPADDCGDDTIEFSGMDVESAPGEHLGDVEGFIVDADAGRPYYVVVDAGGWFKSAHFLLPVGYARFDADREVFVANLTREQVDAFPGFDVKKFDTLTPDELEQLNKDTCRVCDLSSNASPDSPAGSVSSDWDRPAYRFPEWWRGGPAASGRAYSPVAPIEEK
jgi:hypothetical protein